MCGNLKQQQQKPQKQRIVAGYQMFRVGKMTEGDQKVQTSSYKTNKSQECNIQPAGDHS